MKVSELIEKLKCLPPDHIVVMSKDGEGNNFSPLSDYGLYQYTPDSTWSGEITQREDAEQDYQENAVVLWPIN